MSKVLHLEVWRVGDRVRDAYDGKTYREGVIIAVRGYRVDVKWESGEIEHDLYNTWLKRL